MFSLFALTEKQGKSIDCNGSSLPQFSIPSFLGIAIDVDKLLESLKNSSGTLQAGRQSKTLPGVLISSREFRCILDSRLGFLEIEGIQLDVKRGQC